MPEDAYKTLLKDDWLETYEQQRLLLWDQLLTLNCNNFLISKIDNFPFTFFCGIGSHLHFWHLTKRALVDSSLMICWRIIIESDGSTLSLKQFKKSILENFIDEKEKLRFQSELKATDFDKQIKSLSSKVRYIRNKFLAHFDKAEVMVFNPENVVNLDDLMFLSNAAQNLFNILCLREKFCLWPIGYDEAKRSAEQTDIDELLNNLALNSSILNLPDNPAKVLLWKRRKQKLSSNEYEILNFYRRKFGLSEV